MLIVKYNPEYIAVNDVENAIQYTEASFSELSKVWADMGLELLVHKQEVDPMIDIIQRYKDNRIYDAKTISAGEWFVFDPTDYDDWYIVSDEDFTKKYSKIQEVIV